MVVKVEWDDCRAEKVLCTFDEFGFLIVCRKLRGSRRALAVAENERVVDVYRPNQSAKSGGPGSKPNPNLSTLFFQGPMILMFELLLCNA